MHCKSIQVVVTPTQGNLQDVVPVCDRAGSTPQFPSDPQIFSTLASLDSCNDDCWMNAWLGLHTFLE
jgi:hypothetical protein